ncbi:unnamed protein product [Dibothriocephalus latus]|uniref:Uncharacterized protein n=1 Tax=Dibothriocephalus latus TaxID=60516 RepID=A0A3P7LEQ8_DIBLA|nr:unnamed protein product [Dibothriocephalus latus]
MDNSILCSEITTSPDDGKCHVQEKGDAFIFTYYHERIGNESESVFVCNSSDDSQRQVINWHGNGYEEFEQLIPEYLIPVDGRALGNTLEDYLENAQIRVGMDTLILRIAPNSIFSVICAIGVDHISWACVALFKDATMQLLIPNDTHVEVQEEMLRGKAYKIFGSLDTCEGNAREIGELETEHVTLLHPITLTEMSAQDPQENTLLKALRLMLAVGLTPVCG